jgi:hypothetical protein
MDLKIGNKLFLYRAMHVFVALVLILGCLTSSFAQSSSQIETHSVAKPAASIPKSPERFCSLDESLADEMTSNRYATDSAFLYIGLVFIAALTYIYCSNRSGPGFARFKKPVMFLGFALGLIVYASTSIWIFSARKIDLKQNVDNYYTCVKLGGNP